MMGGRHAATTGDAVAWSTWSAVISLTSRAGGRGAASDCEGFDSGGHLLMSHYPSVTDHGCPDPQPSHAPHAPGAWM